MAQMFVHNLEKESRYTTKICIKICIYSWEKEMAPYALELIDSYDDLKSDDYKYILIVDIDDDDEGDQRKTKVQKVFVNKSRLPP